MRIRDETPADVDAIHRLTWDAFKPMPFSDDTEADALRALRARGELTISLVAEDEGEIIGHVAFSPLAINGVHNGWFGLGPISVKPERQRQGVGKRLIAHGLELLRARGARGCALIGNPNVYRSSGFVSDGRLAYRDLPPKVVQRIVFHGPAPEGVLLFASGLEEDRSPQS
jgi:putative acetyltransferase